MQSNAIMTMSEASSQIGIVHQLYLAKFDMLMN